MRATELYFIVCLERDHSRRRATIIKIIRFKSPASARAHTRFMVTSASKQSKQQLILLWRAFEYSRQMPEPLLQQGVKWSALITFYRMRAATARIIRRRQMNHRIARPRQPIPCPLTRQHPMKSLEVQLPGVW